MNIDKSEKPKITADPAQMERPAEPTQPVQPNGTGVPDDQVRGDNQPKPVPGSEG